MIEIENLFALARDEKGRGNASDIGSVFMTAFFTIIMVVLIYSGMEQQGYTNSMTAIILVIVIAALVLLAGSGGPRLRL